MKNFLVIVSGPAGAGKDYVIDEFLKTDIAEELSLSKVRTNADRERRPDEPEDSYYFMSKSQLDNLANTNQLAEEIVNTGFTRKATSKSEILRLFEGQNLVWRVDPTLAAKIAKGEYFEKYFPEYATTLKEVTLLIHIHAPQDVIEKRRQERDRYKYIAEEYKARDEYEKPHLDILLRSTNVQVVENIDDNINITLEKISQIIVSHHKKVKHLDL